MMVQWRRLSSVENWVKPMSDEYCKCPKCNSYHGNSWGECGGNCPMSMSPHFDPKHPLRELAKEQEKKI